MGRRRGTNCLDGREDAEELEFKLAIFPSLQHKSFLQLFSCSSPLVTFSIHTTAIGTDIDAIHQLQHASRLASGRRAALTASLIGVHC
jgi:hypothetical protein